MSKKNGEQQTMKPMERKDAIPELELAANVAKDLEGKLARLKQQHKDQEEVVNTIMGTYGRKKYVFYVGRTKRTIYFKDTAAKLRIQDEQLPPEQLPLKPKQPQA